VWLTPGRGRRLSLVADNQEGRLVVCVADNGRGISPEELPRVTSRFYRSAPGTGLGLSIAERLALAHGGQLQLVSAPGQGRGVFQPGTGFAEVARDVVKGSVERVDAEAQAPTSSM